jgi:sirohydrochlorin cobaltochelatase
MAMATRTGILLVAFGSSREEAHLSLRRFEDMTRERFPGLPVRWAFSSGVVRSKLAHKGKKTDSAAKALEKMWFEKYERVAVQSLHVIPGDEYHELKAVADSFKAEPRSFEALALGEPLISGPDDVKRTADAIFNHIPAERDADEAVVLMGHGTWRPGDSAYDMLFDELRARDEKVLVATMDGSLTVDGVRDRLKAEGVARAHLMPLLAVAGRHVQKDMCGEGPESWVSVLEAAGIECSCVPHGTAGYPDFAAIWLDHLGAALRSLGPA